VPGMTCSFSPKWLLVTDEREQRRECVELQDRSTCDKDAW
jgi:hypothetical protein